MNPQGVYRRADREHSSTLSPVEPPCVTEGRHFSPADPPSLTPSAVFANCTFRALHWHRETFQGLRFSDCRFEAVQFEDCRVEGVEWSRCSLSGVRWSSGSLNESQFHDTTIEDCAWYACALDGLHLTNVRCQRTSFERLESRHLAVVTSEVSEVRFEACQLTDTSWIRGTLENFELRNCDCVNFIFGQLESTNVLVLECRGRNLRWIQCRGIRTELLGCEFAQASWSHGCLIDSRVQMTKLLTVGFDQCTMEDVAFAETTLATAQFDDATLCRSRFDQVFAPGLSLRQARLKQVAFTDIDFQQLDARGATLEAVTFRRAACKQSRLDGQDKALWSDADTLGSTFADPRSPAEREWWASNRAGIRNQGVTS